jgi:hypothetical protein
VVADCDESGLGVTLAAGFGVAAAAGAAGVGGVCEIGRYVDTVMGFVGAGNAIGAALTASEEATGGVDFGEVAMTGAGALHFGVVATVGMVGSAGLVVVITVAVGGADSVFTCAAETDEATGLVEPIVGACAATPELGAGAVGSRVAGAQPPDEAGADVAATGLTPEVAVLGSARAGSVGLASITPSEMGLA